MTHFYYLIIANHCVDHSSGDLRSWAGVGPTGGNLVGSVESYDTAYDMAYVRTTKTAAEMYNGVNGADNAIAIVGAYGAPQIGSTVCVSGEQMRLVCSVDVTSTYDFSVTDFQGNTGPIMHGYILTQEQHAALISKGDSGAPVFRSINNNTQVSALGLESAYLVNDPNRTCPYWVQGSICKDRALITPVNNGIANHHLQVNSIS